MGCMSRICCNRAGQETPPPPPQPHHSNKHAGSLYPILHCAWCFPAPCCTTNIGTSPLLHCTYRCILCVSSTISSCSSSNALHYDALAPHAMGFTSTAGCAMLLYLSPWGVTGIKSQREEEPRASSCSCCRQSRREGRGAGYDPRGHKLIP